MSAKEPFQQLVQAYHLGDLATLETLLDAGVDPDAAPVDDGGDTLLMLAVRQERRDAVLLLLGRGASALIANRAGETAHGLGRQAHDHAIASLFATDAPISAANVRLRQVIERISEGGPPRDVIEHLRGADLEHRSFGLTPLLALAARGAHGPEVYAALLAAGAAPTATDGDGQTVLHHLAHYGLYHEVAAVLDAAPLDAVDTRGRTALHIATVHQAARVVTMLLDRGARTDLRDELGHTAHELARGRIAQILLDRPGVSIRGDLEIALRARWDLGVLAIYGDQLQLEGDPRGELVMLDLAPDPGSSKWRERRFVALDAWLDQDLARRAHQVVRHGFVTHLHDRGGATDQRRPGQSRLAAELLESPAGRYVRSFAISGDAEHVIASLRRLASQQRPHLAELAIAMPGRSRVRVHEAQLEMLITATPSLRSLFILDALPFQRFPHPAVQRCVAAGELEGVAVTPPHPVESRELATLLEAIDTATDAGARFPDLDARLAELERAAIIDDARGLTALGRVILEDGLVQLRTGRWILPGH